MAADRAEAGLASPAPSRAGSGASAAPALRRRWQALAVISVSQLMISVDSTIVNIALPSAQRDLGFSAASRQWVLTAYLLAFGGLLLLGGRIGDLYGRKRVFLAGVTGFAAASVLGGTAVGLTVLIAARALQGTCAALMEPAALSLLTAAFPDNDERTRALGIFSAIAGSGAALISAALMALILGLSQAETVGWAAPEVPALLAASAVLAAVFVQAERRASAPLLPLRLVTDRTRAGVYLSQALSVMTMFGLLLFLTYDLQSIDGYSALKTGVAFLPLVAGMLTGASFISGRLHPRHAPGHPRRQGQRHRHRIRTDQRLPADRRRHRSRPPQHHRRHRRQLASPSSPALIFAFREPCRERMETVITTTTPDPVRLRAAVVGSLTAGGHLRTPAIIDAFTETERHLFLTGTDLEWLWRFPDVADEITSSLGDQQAVGTRSRAMAPILAAT